ncbi:MAG: ThiF family adenylyltransferase [Pyrinomonadaceae bacterium]
MSKERLSTERYDRQERLPGWNQSALSSACVLVAGAGGLSNEVIKNLALMGIGRILVVDFDTIDASNLSRTVLFSDADIGLAKARVAVEAAARLNPAVRLRYIEGDLLYDVGLGFYRHSRLVVGGLDSLVARSSVGANCALAGIPFFDGGMWELGGEARVFYAGEGACFDCSLSDDDRLRAFERRSCTMFRRGGAADGRVMAATVSTASIIGGLLTHAAINFLCGGQTDGGEAVVYSAQRMTMHRTTLPRTPDCPSHRPCLDVTELEQWTNRRRAADLVRVASSELGGAAILELGRDFLLGFSCQECGRSEEVNAPVGKVNESAVACPSCGAPRGARVISRLDGSEPYADRALADLGVPPGEVLTARVGDRLRFYELTGDVRAFWA